MEIIHRFASAVCLTVAVASAQFRSVSCEFSPAVATEGQPVTISVRCRHGASHPDQCGFFKVHPGSQAAPPLPHFASCPATPLAIGAWVNHTYQWDLADYSNAVAPTPVSPGVYWLHVDCFEATGTTRYDDWFCLTVLPAAQAPGSRPATIRPITGNFQIGTTTQVQVSSPDDAGSFFQMFVSFSSNVPVVLPGFVEFGLEAPIELWGGPTPFDLAGNAVVPIALLNQPQVVSLGFVLQMQAVDLSTGFPKPSNCLSVIVKA